MSWKSRLQNVTLPMSRTTKELFSFVYCFLRWQSLPLNVSWWILVSQKSVKLSDASFFKWIIWKTKVIVKYRCPYIHEGVYYYKNQECVDWENMGFFDLSSNWEPSASPFVHEQQKRKDNAPLPSNNHYIENSLIQN